MSRLSLTARDELRYASLTVAEYAGRFWTDRKWHGDTCGCPDDRCAGHHHDEADECGCLRALITEH